MDGSSAGATVAHDRLGRFAVGHTEWRARRDRITQRYEQLLAEFGDVSDTQKQLLRIAAKHLDEAERAKSPVVRTRASRCASQILKLFPKPKAPAPRGPATVAEYFGNGE
jgi:hypothetical protein